MNTEKLVDSIGSIDERYISETDNIRMSGKTKKKTSLRKMIMLPIAAALTLALVGFTAYYLHNRASVQFFSGNPVNDDSLSEAKISYEPETTLIDLAEITGPVNEVSDIIIERFNTMQWDDANELYPVNEYPGSYSLTLSTPGEICDYIGYEGLVVPELKSSSVVLSSSPVCVYVFGDSEGNLYNIIINADYTTTEGFMVQTFTTLFTENQPVPPDGMISMFINTYLDFTEGSDLKESRVVENGREFLVIEQDLIRPIPGIYEQETDFFVKNVFWQENKVIYNLSISFPTDMREEADEVILEWMNSF